MKPCNGTLSGFYCKMRIMKCKRVDTGIIIRENFYTMDGPCRYARTDTEAMQLEVVCNTWSVEYLQQ